MLGIWGLMSPVTCPGGFHIDGISNKANRTLDKVIKRNIRTKMPGVREVAYNTLVQPQLEYAAANWDPHTKDHLISVP